MRSGPESLAPSSASKEGWTRDTAGALGHEIRRLRHITAGAVRVTCDEIERDEIAEQYVRGRLGDEHSARFEAHYFDCARCLDRVEVLQSVHDALAPAVAAKIHDQRPRPATRNRPSLRRLWPAVGGLAAAAILVLAVREIQEPPSSSPIDSPAAPADIALPTTVPTVDLQRLGAIVPPPFRPPRLRSANEAGRAFLSAMEAYSAGNYADAAAGLEQAVRAEPALPAPHFFLGVSYLQLDRRSEAVEQLREVRRLGESPYLEDAHFFLAKAAIRGGDIEVARRELRTVVALDGNRREEASGLLTELR